MTTDHLAGFIIGIGVLSIPLGLEIRRLRKRLVSAKARILVLTKIIRQDRETFWSHPVAVGFPAVLRARAEYRASLGIGEDADGPEA